jgi:hypothetical protein
MRTSNVDQMISKHAFQTSFSLSPRLLDSSSDFHQVHKSPIQVQLFGISHTNGGFSFHVSVCMRNRHSVVIVSLIEGSGGRGSYRG